MTEALFGWPPPVLDPAGPYASSVTTLAWVLFAMGVAVTAIVVAALYVAIKGRPGLKAKLGGEKAIWIAGIGFPVVVLTVLLVWGLTLTARLDRPVSGEEMRIRVSGELFWFRVDYLDAEDRVTMRDANEVHIPVGRPVVFELTSADVIHSFWVPNLSGKKDMVPGRVNLLRVEARKAGQYGGVCAEFCGRAHALMGLVVVAHAPDDWQRWLASRRRPAPRPAAAHRGEALFMQSGCAACHRVAGTRATGLAGPDLSFVGSRRTIGAGILPNNRGTMIGWIGDSQSIKPGNRMPSYDMLPGADTAAIAAWLETLK
jgi:cytochrome c oxidase subunit 2